MSQKWDVRCCSLERELILGLAPALLLGRLSKIYEARISTLFSINSGELQVVFRFLKIITKKSKMK